MFNFTKLAENQPFLRSVLDCSRMEPSTEFTARKILTSSPNNRYLECLIILKRSLTNILKRKGLKNTSLSDPERIRMVMKRCVKCVQKDCRLLTKLRNQIKYPYENARSCEAKRDA